MPLFLDVHELEGVTPDQIAHAHAKDVSVQDQFGVNYVKYWFNQSRGKVFCLCTAPDAESAERVHREAHGMLAERIIELDPDVAEGMLGTGKPAPTGMVLGPGGAADTGLRTIVFTDIVGSTELTQRLGDAAAMGIVDLHDRVVRAALAAHRGREVKHLGDGIMAVFASADDAVRCASEVHRELSTARAVEPVKVRIGAAAGDPVERQGDFFGSAVQLAARLCAKAPPGQTLVAVSVTEQCSARPWGPASALELKGFPQQVLAHTVID